jgi:hypothetical protein
VEEVEERSVAELGPQASVVEGREGEQKVGERGVLAPEQLAEPKGEVACGFHAVKDRTRFEGAL